MFILTRLWIIAICLSGLLYTGCAPEEMIKEENQIEDSASPLLAALLQDGDFGEDAMIFTRDVVQAARNPTPDNDNLLEEASVDISAKLGKEQYFTILHQGVLRFEGEPTVSEMEAMMGYSELTDVEAFTIHLPDYGRATHVSCGADANKQNKICRVSVTYRHVCETITILVAQGNMPNERMQEIVADLLEAADARLSQIDT